MASRMNDKVILCSKHQDLTTLLLQCSTGHSSNSCDIHSKNKCMGHQNSLTRARSQKYFDGSKRKTKTMNGNDQLY
jgi:hypothetical protein